MIKIIRSLQKFGSINKFTNWETDVINAKTPVIVDFHATWCGPCKRLTPVLVKKVEAHPNVTLVKIDIDQFEQLASQNKVQAVPTVLLFNNGKKVAEFVGMPPDAQIDDFFNKIPK